MRGVSGTWKDLTDSVNFMAGNLTSQVRNIALVTTAVATGDLTKKVTVDVKGEIQELKNTINTMVDQLNAFASEVTRVAREVGTEGKLGGQASVPGVAGTWKDLTDNVNLMGSNLTAQVRNIADVTVAVANGDLSKKITVDVRGEFLQLKDTINTMVDQLRAFASEVTRVAREVGTEGRLGGQGFVPGVAGTWKDLTDSVNSLATNLTNQVRNIATVTTAVASGDLSKKITVDVKGEMLELKNTINTMVDQLNSFASEVTRVSREVGTEGKLGGQAQVKGVAGTWKDLTDSVNTMAGNLTDQVRGIAKVVSAVAAGNLKQKLTVAAKGEIANLSDTINDMIDTLALFGDQVTSVAREVGVEGKLGGQANVPGASGIWKDLTDNVNQLAANLTEQVRAIAEVSTAVTKGDLTRSVTVQARGEVAELKDNVNEMIRNLRETTQTNAEQDWLKTNLTKFTRMLQGQRDVIAVAQSLLSELAPLVLAQHGVFYLMETADTVPLLKLLASYGYKERKNLSKEWRIGEGLVGQCAFEKQRILLTQAPRDYIQITSGLGEGTPANIVVLPVLFEGKIKAVFELASFERFSDTHLTFLEQLTESLGIVLNTIEATMKTEDLLKQSQSLAEELQNQQQELQQTNEELEEKARLLAEQNEEVERKNREIEDARGALEEKAEQLALTSKYKSEFLANMSHELRTPLNSLLILSQQLSDNPEKHLDTKEVEYAHTIHSSGQDLLNLINDILDLSKIESGTVTVETEEYPFSELEAHVERTFRHVAQNKKLEFGITLDPGLPAHVRTDVKRLQQVIKNLLSNAFKFTEKGEVTLGAAPVTGGWSRDHEILNKAEKVIAFSVRDTGIGIPPEKQKLIFEAFQQADGSTSRKYGGTGLGLAISREIAYLLGGEIRLTSAPGKGSVFTLYLPQTYQGPARGYLPGSPGEGGAGRGPQDAPRPAGAGPAPLLHPPAGTAQDYSLEQVPDDRAAISTKDKVVLIVEDDPRFARIVLDVARKKGFKGVVTSLGEEVMGLVEKFHPEAITLDVHLPDVDGWTVLDRLKLNTGTQHIAVHLITVEDDRKHGLERGAFAFLKKPVTKADLEKAFARMEKMTRAGIKKVLVVEDKGEEREAIVKQLGNGDIKITQAQNGKKALAALKKQDFDLVVLDLMLPDISGFEVLEEMRTKLETQETPVIIYTAKDLTREEESRLSRMAEYIIIKGVKSPERLLAEATLFLHRVASRLPEEKRQTLEKLYVSDKALEGKKVLIVDDDVRNLFALTTVLERHKLEVLTAENGKDGIETLKKTQGIDIVLMDIMMPGMDGYETMGRIRKIARFKDLPILALTAKAMKGDREKCLEAGASDYITKPVNQEQLLSLMRVWLYR
ncbi:MAG: response regulator [Thermodesulfobacteriota bacterium]